MTQDTQALARNGAGRDLADMASAFVMGLDELRQQVIELDRFKESVMQKGTDYDVIPGTPKPSLLKPGAEKLCQVFGLLPEFLTRDTVKDWDHGFFAYEVECRLVSRRTGLVVANGLGEANSKEGRYRWRDSKPTCPECGMELRVSRNQPEWYCWRQKGGCGATYPLDEIKAGGRVENDDPYTLVNTLLKMAQKRALVAATLVATAASGIFTQDVEDYIPSDAPRVVEVRAQPTGHATHAQPDKPEPQAPAPSRGAEGRAQTAPSGPPPFCRDCGNVIQSVHVRGKEVSGAVQAEKSRQRFGVATCLDCGRKRLEAEKAEPAESLPAEVEEAADAAAALEEEEF